MAPLVYTVIASLDGYTADRQGSFEWAAPDEEVHAFVNDLERPSGTYLLGRRMYEVMTFWEDASIELDDSPAMADYAHVWQSADKIVFSTTLTSVSTRRTLLEKSFDPRAVQALKDSTEQPVSIGGPTLAAHAFAAGLVDEVHVLTAPVVVGGGLAAFPIADRIALRLQGQRRFDSGFTYRHYSV